MTIKEYLQKLIHPAEIIGEPSSFPYIEKDGQTHLFKVEWRALVAISHQGPLVVMSWVGE